MEETKVELTFNEKRARFFEIVEGLDEAVKAEIITLSGDILKKEKKGSGKRQDSQVEVFRNMLLNAEDNKIHSDSLYNVDPFKGAGRHEILTLCRQLHTRYEGDEKIWAQDIVVDGEIYYKILGVGETAPESFKVKRKRKALDEPEEESAPEEVDIH